MEINNTPIINNENISLLEENIPKDSAIYQIIPTNCSILLLGMSNK